MVVMKIQGPCPVVHTSEQENALLERWLERKREARKAFLYEEAVI
jgi:hypothetical protein